MADIMRTYHDVTTLDKGQALSKIKDIMDVSGRTEFYSVLRDTSSILSRVGDSDLVTDTTNRNFNHYLIPGRYYCFTSAGNVSTLTDGTSLAAAVEITALTLKSGKSFTILSNQNNAAWTRTNEGMMSVVKSLALVKNGSAWTVYFSPSLYGESSHVVATGTNSVQSNYWFSAALADIDFIEFKVHYVTGSFASGDDNRIFNLIKRSYTAEDHPNAVYITRNTTGRYSVNISNVSNTARLRAFLNIVLNYNHEYGNDEQTANCVNAAWSLGRTASSLGNGNKFTSSNKGLMEIADIYSAKFIAASVDRLVGKNIVLFNDVNLPAATFIKNVLQEGGVGTVTVHPHSSKNLLENVSFASISHPNGTDLNIGNPNSSNYVSFVENVTLNNKNISDVNSLSGKTLNITSRGDITSLYGTSADFGSITAATINATTKLIVKELAISGISVLTTGSGGTIGGKHLMIFDSSGNMVKRSNTEFNTSIDIATNGLTNQKNHMFLGIDGVFRALTPGYLGASESTHGHGQISNSGAITTSVAAASGDKLIIADASDNSILKALNITFDGSTTNKYLSQNGTWAGIKEILFKGKLSTASAIDDAGAVGFYYFTGYNFINNDEPGNDKTWGIPRTPEYGAGSGGYATGRETTFDGILWVLPISGNDETITGNNITNAIRVVQVAYTIGTNVFKPQVFVRSGSGGTGDNDNSFTWNNWTAFAQTDHTHELEYVKLDSSGSIVLDNISIYPSSSDVSKIINNVGTARNAAHASEQFRSVNNVAALAYNINDTTGLYQWNINNDTKMEVRSSIVSLNTNIDVNSILKTSDSAVSVAKPLKIKTSELSGIASTAASSNEHVMLLTSDGTSNGSGYRTIEYASGITADELYALDGISTTSTIQSQLNNRLPLLKVASLDANGSSLTHNAMYIVRSSISHGAHTNHSVLLDIGVPGGASGTPDYVIGTPFQLQIPDSTEDYVYKRSYSSSEWSAWRKLKAGYADSAGAVAWANVSNKPTATSSVTGLMSSTDKTRLDTIWGLWQADDDNNLLVDKIQEVLNAFDRFGEGDTIVSLLANKLNTSGGTLTGPLTISYGTNNVMSYDSANPQIIFAENGSQPVKLVYTDYDSYRSPAGLKVVGSSSESSSPAWFEVEGTLYSTGASISGNATITGNTTISGSASIAGSITNLAVGGGIYWNPYVESASDGSDAASIRVISGGTAGGTELQIKQANDSNDVINLVSPYYIYLNGKRAFTINDNWLRINEGNTFSSGTYFGSSKVRTDNRLEVGDGGAAFSANTSGETYTSKSVQVNKCKMIYNTSEDCLDFIFS